METENIEGKTETIEDADTAEDLSTFSREELEERIIKQGTQLLELQQKIDDLTNPPPNDWHSWFYALLHIVLFKFQTIDIQREVVLGAQPPRADFVVVKDVDNDGKPIDLGLRIFHIFRKTNIIEFKNPDDELSEEVLWKVVGYAGFYISKYGASPNEVTLTLLRSAKPVKMFKEMEQFVEADETKGIYHIRNWRVDFPIQIIISKELEGKEYAGFRTITKEPKLEDILQIMDEIKETTNQTLLGWYRDFMEQLSKLDSEAIEKAKRRFPEMAKTWRDIFKPEIDEWIQEGRADEKRTNLYTYVQDGAMAIDYAARQANISTEEFRSEMRNHGYRIPQGELV